LTPDEIELIRDAYDKGFILFVYKATEKDMVQIYRDIVAHPFRHAELESLDGIPEGNMHAVFTLEQHEGLDWSGTAQFTMSETRDLLEGEEDDLSPSEAQGEFYIHGFHISEWLDAQSARRQELLAEGLIKSSAVELMDELDLKDEFDEQLGAVTRDTEGTLLDLASANINTNTKYVTFTETTDTDSFQMTSKAWIVTADTDTGLFSFLLVDQDFNLATSQTDLQKTAVRTSTGTLKSIR
jgi:hypothetical protein